MHHYQYIRLDTLLDMPRRPWLLSARLGVSERLVITHETCSPDARFSASNTWSTGKDLLSELANVFSPTPRFGPTYLPLNLVIARLQATLVPQEDFNTR